MLLHEPGENADTTLHASSYLEPSSNTTITEYGTPQFSPLEGDSVNAVYPAKSYQNDPRDIASNVSHEDAKPRCVRARTVLGMTLSLDS